MPDRSDDDLAAHTIADLLMRRDESFDVEALLDRIPVRTLAVASGGAFTYREAGCGPVMVLLHGIGSGSGSWVGLMELLAPAFRTIAWDAPGYGGSTSLPAASPAAADYAQALAELLDALGLDRVALVGHSLGALMAGAFAAGRSDRVRALALVDPAGGYGLAEAAVRAERLNSRLALMAALGPRGMAEQRAGQLLGPDAAPLAKALVAWGMSRLHPEGHEQAARMLADGRLIDDLSRYHGPALVMCGSEDRVTPEAGCRAIAASASGATYRTLPRLGHASYVEAPAMLAAALRGFFEACR